MYLLSMGASVVIESKVSLFARLFYRSNRLMVVIKAGSTPVDLAEKLKFIEIIDALRSKLNLEKGILIFFLIYGVSYA